MNNSNTSEMEHQVIGQQSGIYIVNIYSKEKYLSSRREDFNSVSVAVKLNNKRLEKLRGENWRMTEWLENGREFKNKRKGFWGVCLWGGIEKIEKIKNDMVRRQSFDVVYCVCLKDERHKNIF